MKNFSTLNFSNLIGLVQFVDANYHNPNAFNFYQEGKWVNFSTNEFANNIYALTLGLNALGLKPQTGFGIVAKPSPIWLMIDFAAIANRAISVPIFPDISKENLLFEIENADIKFIFCDCLENLEILQNSEVKFEKIIIYGFKFEGANIVHFEDLLKNGQAIFKQSPQLFTNLSSQIKEDDLATIIYTSGSTGVPKGVEITHKNLISQIKSCGQCFVLDSKTDVALSFLPLAHIFERMVIGLYISQGVNIYFADDVKNIGALLQELKPSLITAVPRMLEKVFSRMESRVDEAGFLQKLIGKTAFKLAGNTHSPLLKKIFDFLVYKKLRDGLGGNLKMMICGGAPLAPDLEKFFWGVGINIFAGYGLTESSPVIAVNYPKNHKLGTVGKPLFDVQVRLGNDGELFAKGDNIMRGYHKNPAKTSQTLIDGWLKTGDLAQIDEEGFVTIVGRKKEMFKTTNGKYVSPVPIEQKLLSNWQLLSAACIIAEGRKFVSCLLFPDFEALPRYKKKAGLEDLSDEEFLKSDFIQKHADKLIAQINSNLNHSEQIQKYYLAPNPISIQTGELTPSMKLKREFVEEKYQEIIEGFYTG
jgi:long-chain acyl-CoA synthetase